jgi:hypothetical protein
MVAETQQFPPRRRDQAPVTFVRGAILHARFRSTSTYRSSECLANHTYILFVCISNEVLVATGLLDCCPPENCCTSRACHPVHIMHTGRMYKYCFLSYRCAGPPFQPAPSQPVNASSQYFDWIRLWLGITRSGHIVRQAQKTGRTTIN